jgi:Mrp family chromosome partitioning ATPase
MPKRSFPPREPGPPAGPPAWAIASLPARSLQTEPAPPAPPAPPVPPRPTPDPPAGAEPAASAPAAPGPGPLPLRRRLPARAGQRGDRQQELIRRAQRPLTGPHRVVVLSRKGGVGTTTVTALLGLALAEHRDDLVVVLDAGPDGGTLAERLLGGTARTVRDLLDDLGDQENVEDPAEIGPPDGPGGCGCSARPRTWPATHR